jgi:hypothetical protein
MNAWLSVCVLVRACMYVYVYVYVDGYLYVGVLVLYIVSVYVVHMLCDFLCRR